MPGTSVTTEILAYIQEEYGVEPEFLWAANDTSAALRHHNTKKWFGALMLEMPREKLRLPGDGAVDILNVKCDPVMIGSLRDGRHILPGYHMNKEHWVSIVLDGALPVTEITPLIDMSFHLTAKPMKKKK